MAKKKKSEEITSEVKKDRLNKHLNEVEKLITEWVSHLDAPNPFHWYESEQSERIRFVGVTPVRPPEYYRLKEWELWACRSVYIPEEEHDTASNHMLRKHLRKRALWRYHTEWKQRLNAISELAAPLCGKAARMRAERSIGWELTEDYVAVALRMALELALGRTLEKPYSHKAPRGVWYYDILIEKSANAQQMNDVAAGHWQIISELGQSKEMLELAQEWQHVLALQEKMKELAKKAIKSSDILYTCQFCRRLWQE